MPNFKTVDRYTHRQKYRKHILTFFKKNEIWLDSNLFSDVKYIIKQNYNIHTRWPSTKGMQHVTWPKKILLEPIRMFMLSTSTYSLLTKCKAPILRKKGKQKRRKKRRRWLGSQSNMHLFQKHNLLPRYKTDINLYMDVCICEKSTSPICLASLPPSSSSPWNSLIASGQPPAFAGSY